MDRDPVAVYGNRSVPNPCGGTRCKASEKARALRVWTKVEEAEGSRDAAWLPEMDPTSVPAYQKVSLSERSLHATALPSRGCYR